jgi:cell fate regulator YaaT (PSP1 superfamily)
VAVCRVAKILDSLLYLLSGPSLLKDIKSSQCKYPLESFDDWSFESSRTSEDIAVGQPSSKASKDEMLPFEEMISVRDAEQLRIQHELTSKKLKLTQDLQDQFKEQQKVLKKQVIVM